MSKSKNKLITAVSGYLAKVEEKLKMGGTPLFYEQNVTMAAGLARQYDIKTKFSEHALFHLMSARVEVLVKNKDSASETYDMFINSEAVITTAINANGIVKIHNTSDESQTVVIKIFTPSVKK